MWKYVSRRIRADTLERNANHFEKRSCPFGGISSDDKDKQGALACPWFSKHFDSYQNDDKTDCPNGIFADDKDKRTAPQHPWFKHGESYQNDNNTNSKRRNFDHRRIRDSLERNANHFENHKDEAAPLPPWFSKHFDSYQNDNNTKPPNGISPDDKKDKWAGPLCQWFSKHFDSDQNHNNTNSKRWNNEHVHIRDALERKSNHFKKHSSTGFASCPNGICPDDKDKRGAPSHPWFSKHCGSYQNDNNTNSKRWNFEHLNRTWIGAITWSSALVIGWYASQLLHLKNKCRNDVPVLKCPSINSVFSALHPYMNYVKKIDGSFKAIPNIESVIKTFTPTVHLISNEQDGVKQQSTSSSGNGSSSNTSPDASDNDLGEVLNSIENKLGLAAIENGHHQDGLNLLRSAASRNHAPAQYNLGLCYEMGLGVVADEKMAMELYRSAAAREHPAALYNLGIYYGQGRGGLTRDISTATRLLRLAAVQGQEDAIKALKELDVEPVEPTRRNDADTWTYAPPPYLHNDNIVPTHSTLFVENAQMFHTKIY